MACFGLWMAVLAASFFAVMANSPPVPVSPKPDLSFICKRFSRDGSSLSKSEVFDMIMVNFSQIKNMGTEKLKEFVAYADADQNDRLSLDECEKLAQHLYEIGQVNTPGQ